MKGDGYIHDLFVSILVREALEVRRLLRRRYNHPLLCKYRIRVPRPEVILFSEYPDSYPFVYADVVWFISNSNGEKASIVHEVKTGEFKLSKILETYGNASAIINNYPVVPLKNERTLLCIWSWRWRIKQAMKNELHMDLINKAIKSGKLRLCYLEWIYPIFKEVLREINKIAGGEYGVD